VHVSVSAHAVQYLYERSRSGESFLRVHWSNWARSFHFVNRVGMSLHLWILLLIL
jgi:hypothetical protein